jgi:D-arabinose 1-dehydrogenase-like Zn-dependent alcohol dehydrogenase
MRAIRLVAPGRPLEEAVSPNPDPGPGEVLIEVRAAGICHSDAHYRQGSPSPRELPRTLGHEISGVVTATGPGVSRVALGARVAVNYVLHCGTCPECRRGQENHCPSVGMIGSSRDGGHAELVVVPERNVLPIPESLSFPQAAVMMCSTATAYHALRLAGLASGESVCLLGFGGLGLSALLVARAIGPHFVLAVDRVPEKLAAAARLGAHPLEASPDLAAALLSATEGRGVDVVLDFAGRPQTTEAALQSLARRGRLVAVALSNEPVAVRPYRDLIGGEARLLGCNDHLTSELGELITLARNGSLDLSPAITRTVPLEAAAINQALDEMDAGTPHFRTVVVPSR